MTEDVERIYGLLGPELRVQLEQGVKAIEVPDVSVANLIEKTGRYYMDGWSESRRCYILMRRERT